MGQKLWARCPHFRGCHVHKQETRRLHVSCFSRQLLFQNVLIKGLHSICDTLHKGFHCDTWHNVCTCTCTCTRAYSPDLVLSLVANPLHGAIAPHTGKNFLTLSRSADYFSSGSYMCACTCIYMYMYKITQRACTAGVSAYMYMYVHVYVYMHT